MKGHVASSDKPFYEEMEIPIMRFRFIIKEWDMNSRAYEFLFRPSLQRHIGIKMHFEPLPPNRSYNHILPHDCWKCVSVTSYDDLFTSFNGKRFVYKEKEFHVDGDAFYNALLAMYNFLDTERRAHCDNIYEMNPLFNTFEGNDPDEESLLRPQMVPLVEEIEKVIPFIQIQREYEIVLGYVFEYEAENFNLEFYPALTSEFVSRYGNKLADEYRIRKNMLNDHDKKMNALFQVHLMRTRRNRSTLKPSIFEDEGDYENEARYDKERDNDDEEQIKEEVEEKTIKKQRTQ